MSQTAKLVFKSKRQLVSEGTIQGVLAEIVDLGVVDTPWGPKEKVKLIFEVTEKRDGTDIPLTVSIDFNNTWGKSSKLFEFVEKLVGRQLTAKEILNFDPDCIAGKNALLTILHRESKGNIYANITGVMPLLPGMDKLSVSKNYTSFAELKAKWDAEKSTEAPVVSVENGVAVVNTEDYEV